MILAEIWTYVHLTEKPKRRELEIFVEVSFVRAKIRNNLNILKFLFDIFSHGILYVVDKEQEPN